MTDTATTRISGELTNYCPACDSEGDDGIETEGFADQQHVCPSCKAPMTGYMATGAEYGWGASQDHHRAMGAVKLTVEQYQRLEPFADAASFLLGAVNDRGMGADEAIDALAAERRSRTGGTTVRLRTA